MKKNILIVGASSGIGHQIAKELGSQGHHIISISRSAPDFDTDFSYDHHDHDILSGVIPSDYLPEAIDGVVYCPGSINLKPFRSLKADDFMNDFQINVLGAVNTLQSVQKPIKKSQTVPSVVLFSTVAVQQGMAFHASVASAKGAVEGLTRSLAAEWAPRIRVNCIAPSLVQTPLAGKLLSSEDKIESGNKRHPLQRIGQPEDIAHMATYLLDDRSSWITGQVFGVDGGLSKLR